MKTIRRLASLVLVVAVFAAPAGAQVAVDSVEVQIYAAGDIEVTISPRDYRGMVGDTVQFEVTAVDAPTGDTLDVVLNWSTPDEDAVDLDPMTGEAVFLSRGSHIIRVEVERVGGIVLYQILDGDVVPVPEEGITMEVGEERQLCAYVTNDEGTFVARSSDVCPFPGESPGWAFTWPNMFQHCNPLATRRTTCNISGQRVELVG